VSLTEFAGGGEWEQVRSERGQDEEKVDNPDYETAALPLSYAGIAYLGYGSLLTFC
jgi:hypothetical protein